MKQDNNREISVVLKMDPEQRMNLDSILNNGALKQLNECDSVYFGPNSLESYFTKNTKTLNLINNGEILNSDLLDGIVMLKIIDEVKMYIHEIVKRKGTNNPLHVKDIPRPEFLAYVIDNRSLSEYYIKKIPFDGWTPGYFAQVHRINNIDIVSKIRQELLHPSEETIQKYNST